MLFSAGLAEGAQRSNEGAASPLNVTHGTTPMCVGFTKQRNQLEHMVLASGLQSTTDLPWWYRPNSMSIPGVNLLRYSINFNLTEWATQDEYPG